MLLNGSTEGAKFWLQEQFGVKNYLIHFIGKKDVDQKSFHTMSYVNHYKYDNNLPTIIKFDTNNKRVHIKLDN